MPSLYLNKLYSWYKGEYKIMLYYIHHYPWFHRGSGLTPRSLNIANYSMHNANRYNSIKLMLTMK